MFMFIMGMAANGTDCGACRMSNESANRILQEVRAELSYDELVEAGLAPAKCETCEE